MDKLENLTGFVALIDVLGFRELVNRDTDLQSVRRYVETVTTHLENGRYDELQFVLFSDNVVINTRDDNRASLHTLIHACSDILFTLVQHEIAVRGAIAHGRFMRSPTTRKGVVLAGRPIVEAEYYQHSQKWMGIMLTPSVVNLDNPTLQKECGKPFGRLSNEDEGSWLERNALRIRLIRWPTIPFESEDSIYDYSGFAICPMSPDILSIPDVIKSLRNTILRLEFMKSAAPNPASQRKYSATLSFIQSIQQDWRP